MKATAGRLLAALLLLAVHGSAAADPEPLPLPARGAHLQAGAIRKQLVLRAWAATPADGGVRLTTTRWTRRGEGELADRFSLATLPTREDAGAWTLASQESLVLPEGLTCEAEIARVFRGPFGVSTVPEPGAPEMARYVGRGKSTRTRVYRCSRLPGDAGWNEPLLAPGLGVIELSFDDDMTSGVVVWGLPAGL